MRLREPPKLADFTGGWRHHPGDDGIVFVSRIELFQAAVRDSSSRAVIWEVPEDKKTGTGRLSAKPGTFH